MGACSREELTSRGVGRHRQSGGKGRESGREGKERRGWFWELGVREVLDLVDLEGNGGGVSGNWRCLSGGRSMGMVGSVNIGKAGDFGKSNKRMVFGALKGIDLII